VVPVNGFLKLVQLFKIQMLTVQDQLYIEIRGVPRKALGNDCFLDPGPKLLKYVIARDASRGFI
jgi:hypothetical protein